MFVYLILSILWILVFWETKNNNQNSIIMMIIIALRPYDFFLATLPLRAFGMKRHKQYDQVHLSGFLPGHYLVENCFPC